MAKPELGTKRLCGSCAAKFYDLNNGTFDSPEDAFIPWRWGETLELEPQAASVG